MSCWSEKSYYVNSLNSRLALNSQIAQNLNTLPGFTVTQRAVRDRYGILEKKAKKRQCEIENGTETSPDDSEVDLALGEIMEKWEAAEQEFQTHYQNKPK